jgi:hypothetical protein
MEKDVAVQEVLLENIAGNPQQDLTKRVVPIGCSHADGKETRSLEPFLNSWSDN